MAEGLAAGVTLLVDDDDLYRRALARAMNLEGVATLQSASVGEALTILREHATISRAVIDLQLAGDSGLVLLRAIKADFPSVRAVVLSAFCSTVVAVEAIRNGAIDCLPKSTSVTTLLTALETGAPARVEDDDRLPSLAHVEWEYIQRVMFECGGNVSRAARRLGIHRQSLQRKLRRDAPAK